MTNHGPVSSIPLMVVTQHREGGSTGPFIKPSDLPSAKFKYSVWHDLENNVLNADELRYPRIRKGLPSEERWHEDVKEDEDPEAGNKRNWLSRRRNYRNQHENWEEVKVANLSYQNLGDSFQVNNFLHVVGRLASCVELHLVSNELRDLSGISLPNCRILNLTSNHMTSFKNLPSTKHLEHLNMTENNIHSTEGCEKLKVLKSLCLTRNPISYSFDYRARIFAKFPQLLVLDEIPKLQEDEEFQYGHKEKDSCVIC